MTEVGVRVIANCLFVNFNSFSLTRLRTFYFLSLLNHGEATLSRRRNVMHRVNHAKRLGEGMCAEGSAVRIMGRDELSRRDFSGQHPD
jgi:hypothetical protein